jgi:hypothetical protein
MEVAHWQGFVLHGSQPIFFLCSLAAGAVAVSAGVVAYSNVLTGRVGAGVYMATHGCGSALAYNPQSFLNITIGLVLAVKLLVKFPNNLSQR